MTEHSAEGRHPTRSQIIAMWIAIIGGCLLIAAIFLPGYTVSTEDCCNEWAKSQSLAHARTYRIAEHSADWLAGGVFVGVALIALGALALRRRLPASRALVGIVTLSLISAAALQVPSVSSGPAPDYPCGQTASCKRVFEGELEQLKQRGDAKNEDEDFLINSVVWREIGWSLASGAALFVFVTSMFSIGRSHRRVAPRLAKSMLGYLALSIVVVPLLRIGHPWEKEHSCLPENLLGLVWGSGLYALMAALLVASVGTLSRRWWRLGLAGIAVAIISIPASLVITVIYCPQLLE